MYRKITMIIWLFGNLLCVVIVVLYNYIKIDMSYISKITL